MGLLVDGVWHDEWYDTDSTGGKFKRSRSQFRNWVTKDGSAGPTGKSGFEAEKDRYHLYVSYACPWAHRTLIMRALKGLEDIITVSAVNPLMLEEGWSFKEWDHVIPDNVNSATYLHQVYTVADPNYSGRVTIPVLWDKKQKTIVSNESSEIIRMFNSAFDEVGAKEGDFYPTEWAEEIDEMNEFVYDAVNNGVYKAGFATKQEVYEQEVTDLFNALDQLEAHLEDRKYLVGDKLTEADIRLWTTLIRFDPVYVGHFKCNIRQLVDYPNLWRYTCQIYHIPRVKETVFMDHIKHHYYRSHPTINPNRIVPVGPLLDYSL